MKRLFLLLLAPLLMATTCEDDFDNSGFETTYFIKNDSSTDLFILSDGDRLIAVGAQSTLSIGSDLSAATEPIVPSESSIFSEIKLYKMENEDFILVYGQNPINDSLWEFDEPTVNRYEFTLLITAGIID